MMWDEDYSDSLSVSAGEGESSVLRKGLTKLGMKSSFSARERIVFSSSFTMTL